MKIVTIARIYIKEGDKIESHNLIQEIFKLLHDQHKVHGVTVFRGVAGSGSRGGSARRRPAAPDRTPAASAGVL
jgi:PII-like signaling protein